MISSEDLKNEMAYCYGTEKYYKTGYPFVATDGIKTFVTKADAVWIINLVGSVFLSKHKYFIGDDLITIDLKVKDGKADIIFKDDDLKVFHKQHIGYTDCPNGDWLFYFQNNVFFWNGEY